MGTVEDPCGYRPLNGHEPDAPRHDGTNSNPLRDRDMHLIGGPMDVPAIGRRIAFVTDNIGNIIELAEPGTWPSDRQS